MLRTTFAALAAVLLTLACGSSSSKTPQVGAGSGGGSSGGSSGGALNAGGAPSSAGTSGTGAGTAGSSSAGGSGGSFVLGDSLAEACIAYAAAACRRNGECFNDPFQSCIRATLLCPDLVASPGATRTAAGLKACAETYKTFPCEDMVAGKVPPCVTPGTRAAGEPCVYASQCSSLTCIGNDGECGICARLVARGATCDELETVCPDGDYCGPDGTCVEYDASALLPAGPGEPCTLGEPCTPGYRCEGTAAAATCAALPKPGDPCTQRLCAPDDYCLDGLTCTPKPGLGEPCGLSGSGAMAHATYCGGATICHYDATAATGTCLPIPLLGEPCVINPDFPDSEPKWCGYGLKCDESVSPPLCAVRANPGDPCDSVSECSPGQWCDCAEGTSECAAKTCWALSYADQPCTAPGVRCHAAFSCEAGVCKPRELQGHFAMCAP